MPALVTGCAGFIGSHLTEALLSDGQDVVGVDCFNDNYGRTHKLRNLERALAHERFEFVPVDLARGDLEEFVAASDVVFHLAAEPGVRSSWGARFETYLRNNVVATQHLLEATRRHPSTRLVYASSSSVYGDAECYPTLETATPRPYSPYGVTKLAAEHLCLLYRRNFDLETVALRFFSVYGPRQRPDMAFSRFLHAALDGDPVHILGDGGQTRDFTYVDDVVAALRAAAEASSAPGRIYNVGGGTRASVNHVLELIAGMIGHPLEIERAPAEHGDVRDTSADIQLAAAELDYRPSASLEDGLSVQLDWTVKLRAQLVETRSQSRRASTSLR
ncbi:MAG: UDP-glucose 4-epimerase [Solirubrobacterales bacterium]|nr:MAG: UDP-glucose 4-epimerase [Solirubrobacterales bacterium]